MYKKIKTNVTAFLEVYNEEERIEACLKSLLWVDEIILIDKSSSDNTVQLASKYTKNIHVVEYCDAAENVISNFNLIKTDGWILFPVASTLIHPGLISDIVEITSKLDSEYDVIGLPYKFYSHGIYSKHSPWHLNYKYLLGKKSVIRMSTELHREFTFNSTKVFNIKLRNHDVALYHCTHADLKKCLASADRYTNYEARYIHQKYKKPPFLMLLTEIFKAVFHVTFRRKSIFCGWDNFALSLAFVDYRIMKFLKVWDLYENNNKISYSDLRSKIMLEWEKEFDSTK